MKGEASLFFVHSGICLPWSLIMFLMTTMGGLS
jgi:hypothetical protein